MSIYETIGLCWVIFTSALATVAIIWLAILGLKFLSLKKDADPEPAPTAAQLTRLVKS